ncbi:unnamed protein product [Periconia digitata]|uniref:Uncharacterized protein n=1 Tax=Periconia digitata TaxID=1303443 RepID=A0A9W4U8L3_9PLEO|nr:unnamed protein product [Periconia digitata]
MATNNRPNVTREEILALLCDWKDPWTFGTRCWIQFKRDGNGQLSCDGEQRSYLAVEFSWSFKNEPSEPRTVQKNIFKANIEITLSPRMHSMYHKSAYWLKGAALQEHLQNPPPPSEAPFPWAPVHSAAFRPKEYAITLSRGRFIDPGDYWRKGPYPILQKSSFDLLKPSRYACKLVFDKSPFPPREKWTNDSICTFLDYSPFYEWKEFVRDSIDARDQTWVETLNLDWWFSPSSGEGYQRNS